MPPATQSAGANCAPSSSPKLDPATESAETDCSRIKVSGPDEPVIQAVALTDSFAISEENIKLYYRLAADHWNE